MADRSLSPGRLWALVKKEFLQIKRDSSTFLMGVVLPIILIIIMGFGMSLDVRNVPVAVVLLDSSPTARSAVSFVEGSEYFSPHYVTSMKEAEEMLLSHEVHAAVVVPGDFAARVATGGAEVQLLLNGVEVITAMSDQRYIESAVLTWAANNALTASYAQSGMAGMGQVAVVSRDGRSR